MALNAVESAAEVFKDVNRFSDFDPDQSYLSLKVTTYGLKNELPIISPTKSSLFSTDAKMCRANCEETFQTSSMLEKREVRLWATFVAVQTGLRENTSR